MDDRPRTTRAQHALALAEEAAAGLGDQFLGTEHLLLGLLAERTGPAAQILHCLGVRDEDVRALVLRMRAAT
jgi:ATP-dependent Clp protease ATP-binding subunit ClpC